MKKLLIIINPAAGRGGFKSFFGEAMQVLGAGGMQPSLFFTGKRGDATVFAAEHALEYDLDQDKVAEHFGISPSSLYRMFKTVHGDNYKHYVTDLRIKKACIYLDEGFSVQEVCGMIGYNNVSYFIKTFKSMTGYTPNNYKSREPDPPIVG